MAPGDGRRRRGDDDPRPPVHHRGTSNSTTSGARQHHHRRHHRHRRRERRGPRTAGAFPGHQGRQPPVRDLLQRWRRCLASLLFFTVLLTEHAGGAVAAAEDLGVASPPPPPPPPRPPEALSAAAAAVQQVASSPATSNTPTTANPPTAPAPPPEPPEPPPPPPPRPEALHQQQHQQPTTTSPPPPSSPPPAYPGAFGGGPPPPDLSDVDNRTCPAAAARDVWAPPPSEAVADYECPAACPPDGGGGSGDSSSGSANQTTTQCLYYLEEMAQGEAACAAGEDRLRALHLKHCCELSVWSALPPEARAGGPEVCTTTVQSILEADELSRRITCEFDNVLDRYDCGQVYSVRFGCDNCKAAYRRWVCSSLLPLYAEFDPPHSPPSPPTASSPSPSPPPVTTSTAADTQHHQPDHHHQGEQHRVEADQRPPPRPADGERVWPCRAVCHTVEQRCPFVLPLDRVPGHPTQYAGEPSFICQDPNIPEIEVQLENSAYGDHRPCCYTHCPSAPGPPHSPSASDFLLPAGDRAVTNTGRGVCFHCLRRGGNYLRSITPGGGGGGGAEEDPTSGSPRSTSPWGGGNCWRLLVLQGLLLCLARRTLSLSFVYEYT